MSQFDAIDAAVADIKSGKMVVIVDDEDRENEGDLVMAASKVTADSVNFMAREGRGLICVPLSEEIAERLDLLPMVLNNSDKKKTNFTVSVDLKEGTSSGISMSDRANTIKALSKSDSKPNDFSKPGHVFPLRAKKSGVLARAGHTEAAVDLTMMANLPQVGVICEIIKDDGEMARLPELVEFCKKHNLRIISIRDLIAYKGNRTFNVCEVGKTDIVR
ncbi:3,4-dihydroxy-2-butanone-4-phosphate synthase [Patescibacteria group bacterium]|nr:3,4-dihydroxy-2-butanone-4-phosphate synthase [Patescibacteria group bacterium]MBU1702922.1 3,4-dihydroxy-2-butanone-4-phosphate synthase [Patescibacteria group bacterium]MBU1953488.1 3,4-dihydroxy-2-butanone-4-phosphate synthase [Patescibacteria group bacterium]